MSGTPRPSAKRDEKPDGRGGGAPWWRDGLRFECTCCGNCCSGEPGAVWFDREEGQKMAAKLGMSEKDFLKTYARKIGARWSLQERTGPAGLRRGHDCALLDRESVPGKALCKVYQDRPKQCHTWPFWERTLSSRKAWDEAKKSAPCPGMGSGPLIPAEKILEALRAERASSEGAAW
ncbi:MAG: YkgJ family cysteine cluster protein [Planctomycetes bacterium]|nr:YkgJ family cysteine cluster protein [Planctomycetota bacterium]